MRDVSIEKMEAKADNKRMDKVVGAGFDKNLAEESTRTEEASSDFFSGWSRIICFF